MKTKLKAGALQKITARFALDESTTEELIEEVAENIEHKPVFDEAKLRELAGDNYEEIVKLIGGEAGQAEDEVRTLSQSACCGHLNGPDRVSEGVASVDTP